MADYISRDRWDRRPDGSLKGDGYFGVLSRPDGGVSSEISVCVNLDGQETEIPALVPTLNPAEVRYLLSMDVTKDRVPDTIVQKAVTFARQRRRAGQPVFAKTGEQYGGLYPQFPRATPMPYGSDYLTHSRGGVRIEDIANGLRQLLMAGSEAKK